MRANKENKLVIDQPRARRDFLSLIERKGLRTGAIVRRIFQNLDLVMKVLVTVVSPRSMYRDVRNTEMYLIIWRDQSNSRRKG